MDQRNYGILLNLHIKFFLLSSLVDNTEEDDPPWYTSPHTTVEWPEDDYYEELSMKFLIIWKRNPIIVLPFIQIYFQAENMHASSCYVTLCVKVLAFKTLCNPLGEGWPFFSAHRSQSGYDGMFIVADSLHIITVFVFRAVFLPFSDVLSLRE